MAEITSDVLLSKVKGALGITGDYQNDTLSIYIDEVKCFMEGAGLSESTVDDEKSVGVISIGVSDLWRYGAGETSFSEYFKQRVIQMAYREYKAIQKTSDVDEPKVVENTLVGAELQVNGNDVVKSGQMIFSNGDVVPIEVKPIPPLTVSATPMTYENMTTTLTIVPELGEGNHYLYRLGGGTLPAYGEVISNASYWTKWNGVDVIDTDGAETIYLVECNSDNVAIRGAVVDVIIEF